MGYPLSEVQRGRTLSPEHRAKLSAAGKGKPKSPEARAKQSAGMKAAWARRKAAEAP